MYISVGDYQGHIAWIYSGGGSAKASKNKLGHSSAVSKTEVTSSYREL